MAIERIAITDRDQWLALRQQDVTASTIASLSNLHPYVSRRKLYLEKTGRAEPDEANEMLDWRLMLEPVVGAAVAKQRPEWRIERATEYLRDPEARIGATPDFYVHGDPRGLGVLQAKTADPSSFRKHWSDGVPFYVVLQNATELMLETKAAFGVVACMVIQSWKCICPIFEIERHPGVEAKIRSEAERFWLDVEFENEPEPDFKLDADAIELMHPEPTVMSRVDLTGDNYLTDALFERERLKDQVNTANERIKEIDTELKAKMGDAGIAVVGPFYALQKNIDVDGYTVAPRRYRRLTVTNMLPKEAPADGQPARF